MGPWLGSWLPTEWSLHISASVRDDSPHLAGLVLGGKVCVQCLVQGKHLMTKWWLCPVDGSHCFSCEGAVWGGGFPSELWAQVSCQSRDPALLLLSFLSHSEVAPRAGGVGTGRVWNLSGLGIVPPWAFKSRFYQLSVRRLGRVTSRGFKTGGENVNILKH